MTGTRLDVLAALKERYGQDNVMLGKDSGFYIRGRGFVGLAVARRETGILAPKRECREGVLAWGDYAVVAMLNGRSRG